MIGLEIHGFQNCEIQLVYPTARKPWIPFWENGTVMPNQVKVICRLESNDQLAPFKVSCRRPFKPQRPNAPDRREIMSLEELLEDR